MPLLYVAVGSALGGMARHLLAGALQRPGQFPAGTLAVNLIGSFVIGVVLRLSAGTALVPDGLRLFLGVGLCGGFTTFSAFSWETLALAEQGDWPRAALYAGASVAGSLAACAAGIAAARGLVAAFTP